jgi:NADH-quinone oxidoreductase subunit J
MLDQAFFYLFASVILLGGLLTITRRSAVHSAIFLIATLLGIAGLFLHLQAEFLAGAQVILYVGGIMVLFLFVIMLVNLDQAARQRQFNRQWWLALLAAAAVCGEALYGLYRGRGAFTFPGAVPGNMPPNTQAVGNALYQNYMLPFEVASIMLLVAMVGAVVMAKKRL